VDEEYADECEGCEDCMVESPVGKFTKWDVLVAVFGTLVGIFGSIAGGFESLARSCVAAGNLEVSRDQFHQQAAMELERIVADPEEG
jgi:ferredoxin